MSNLSKDSIDSVINALDTIRANVPKNMAARVGVLGSHSARNNGNDLTNPEIMLIQEFGSLEKNIPPRSALRMPLETHIGEIADFMAQPAIVDMILGGEAEKAFKLTGIKAESIIQEAFATRGFGQWKPNSPVTIDKKGSSQPLIDTAQLRRAVSSEVVGG